MAKTKDKVRTKVSEENLKVLVSNWAKMSIQELAVKLGVGESTVTYWAGNLKKAMKANGMSNEEIKKIFPPKRRAGSSQAYDKVVKELFQKKTKK